MPLIDNGSILMSIKKLLNVEHDDPAFDTDIGMGINGVFMTLHQLGIGPEEGFFITDANTKWSEFSDDKTLIETVKMYVYMKVRMIFDPPASSVVADAFNARINELEFRLNVQAERNWKDEESGDDPEPSPTPGPEPEPEKDPEYEYEIDGENMTFHGDFWRGDIEPQ